MAPNKSKTILVTGCAGFIGSNLVDRLLCENNKVIGIDNLSTGKINFLNNALKNKNFVFHQIDLFEANKIISFFAGVDLVFHLSANADVKDGPLHPDKDIKQNTLVTFNVLESMRANNVKKIIFSSTGSVYGEAKVFPTPEDTAFPIQTSLYGASKLACEGLISAFSESFGINSIIFRFVSILGERYTHGHVFDFYRQLKINPNALFVLGDGHQKKSYLNITDCIEALAFFSNKDFTGTNIYNLGHDEYCEVNDSIKWICEFLNANPKLSYSGGRQGWIGDNPFILLDTKKIKKLGWKPKITIKESIFNTVKYLKNNEWVFDVK